MPMSKKIEISDEEDNLPSGPLSTEERKKLRKLIMREERLEWFWGSFRVWLSWVSGAVITGYGVYEAFKGFLKH